MGKVYASAGSRRRGFILLALAMAALACTVSGDTRFGENAAADALKALVPGGVCPAAIPRAVATEHPTIIGPGTGQKIVVMSLPKMGSTTMANELAGLGYGTSHDLGDAFACEGVEAIANACETGMILLDKRHPDATWIVLYDPTFTSWFVSAMRWLWVQYCPRGATKVRAVAHMWSSLVERAAPVFDVKLKMSKDQLRRRVLDKSERICHNEELRQDTELLIRMMNEFLADPEFTAAMRQRYEVYHAFLYCFLENKPHVVIDVRGDPQPYKTLAPWIRNGTQEVDVNQMFNAFNVHGRNGTHTDVKTVFTDRNMPPGGCRSRQC